MKKRILGIDLGDVRTGIAVSDAMQMLAGGVGTITAYNDDRLLDEIAVHVKYYDPELIVIGYPINMDGSLGFQAQNCIDFSQKILGFDIIKEDEFADVTFSGGDPLYQVEAFTELARRIKEETRKTIWCYTGFTYEEVLADERLSMILPYLDVLVEGPFIAELRTTELAFRGSSNQRIIKLNQ